MAENVDFCPSFMCPPVVETRIGIQFSPLIGFKSGHFGLFFEECLGSKEWRLLSDQLPTPKEMERFGSKVLRPNSDKQEDDIPQVCMNLTNKDNSRSVQFQTNKLVYSWIRRNASHPSYHEVRSEFDKLFSRLKDFAAKWGMGDIAVNLWKLSYVNTIRPGKLWENPADWNRVLPGIFPSGGPRIIGHDWSTFDGSWFFEMPRQVGRVKVRVQKAVANQTEEVLLLLVITARGEIGQTGASDWSSGLELGHQSAVRVFHDIASPEARKEWGMQS